MSVAFLLDRQIVFITGDVSREDDLRTISVRAVALVAVTLDPGLRGHG